MRRPEFIQPAKSDSTLLSKPKTQKDGAIGKSGPRCRRRKPHLAGKVFFRFSVHHRFLRNPETRAVICNIAVKRQLHRHIGIRDALGHFYRHRSGRRITTVNSPCGNNLLRPDTQNIHNIGCCSIFTGFALRKIPILHQSVGIRSIPIRHKNHCR